jgi:hypothetical protein
MSSRSTRLLAAAAIAVLTLLPAAAEAADCSADISPSPGWVGAVVTFTGQGLEPNVGYDIRIGGGPIINLAASPTGTFSYQYTIPVLWDSGVSSVGETEWYVFVNSGCKPMGDVAEPYTVLANQPTTTTAAPTTTAAATTTTTTATAATAATTTTTVAATTTTEADDGTTTSAVTATTTTETGSGGGGTSPLVIALLAAVVGALVFVGMAILRTRRG